MPLIAVGAVVGGVAIALAVSGDGPDEDPSGSVTHAVEFEIERDPDVPPLPFDDNPDPTQCGIPVELGDDVAGWLSGMWDGELIQPEVLVYDSHLRVSVTGGAPHGAEVEVVMFQENPVLDYYFVRIPGDSPQEGWVPSAFLSFEPVADSGTGS